MRDISHEFAELSYYFLTAYIRNFWRFPEFEDSYLYLVDFCSLCPISTKYDAWHCWPWICGIVILWGAERVSLAIISTIARRHLAIIWNVLFMQTAIHSDDDHDYDNDIDYWEFCFLEFYPFICSSVKRDSLPFLHSNIIFSDCKLV